MTERTRQRLAPIVAALVLALPMVASADLPSCGAPPCVAWTAVLGGGGNGDYDSTDNAVLSSDGTSLYVGGSLHHGPVAGDPEYDTNIPDAYVASIDPASGALRWGVRIDTALHGAEVNIRLAVTPDNSVLLVAYASQADEPENDYPFDWVVEGRRTSDGNLLWDTRLNGGLRSPENRWLDMVSEMAINPQGTTVFVAGVFFEALADPEWEAAYARAAVAAVRILDGEVLWIEDRSGPNEYALPRLEVDATRVYLATNIESESSTEDYVQVWAFAGATGVEVWSASHFATDFDPAEGERFNDMALSDSALLLAGHVHHWGASPTSDLAVRALDLATGQQLWAQRLDTGTNFAGVAGSRGAEYIFGIEAGPHGEAYLVGAIGDNTGVFAYSSDGDLLWVTQVPPPTAEGFGGADIAVASSDGHRLVIVGNPNLGDNHWDMQITDIHPGTGRIRNSVSLGTSGREEFVQGALMAPGNDAIFVYGQDGLGSFQGSDAITRRIELTPATVPPPSPEDAPGLEDLTGIGDAVAGVVACLDVPAEECPPAILAVPGAVLSNLGRLTSRMPALPQAPLSPGVNQAANGDFDGGASDASGFMTYYRAEASSQAHLTGLESIRFLDVGPVDIAPSGVHNEDRPYGIAVAQVRPGLRFADFGTVSFATYFPSLTPGEQPVGTNFYMSFDSDGDGRAEGCISAPTRTLQPGTSWSIQSWNPSDTFSVHKWRNCWWAGEDELSFWDGGAPQTLSELQAAHPDLVVKSVAIQVFQSTTPHRRGLDPVFVDDLRVLPLNGHAGGGYVPLIEPQRATVTPAGTNMQPDNRGNLVFNVASRDVLGRPIAFSEWQAKVTRADAEGEVLLTIGSMPESDVVASTNDGDDTMSLRIPASQIRNPADPTLPNTVLLHFTVQALSQTLEGVYSETANQLAETEAAGRADAAPATPILLRVPSPAPPPIVPPPTI